MAWWHPWQHSWQKWREEWKYQRAWGLQLRGEQAVWIHKFKNTPPAHFHGHITWVHHIQCALVTHTITHTLWHPPTHPHILRPSKKDISTPPGPALPCGWGCWGWGSRGLLGPWGQTCSPALPSWPPLLFFWLSQWTPGCLIFPHRPQEEHLSKKTKHIMLFCFKASQIRFKAQNIDSLLHSEQVTM